MLLSYTLPCPPHPTPSIPAAAPHPIHSTQTTPPPLHPTPPTPPHPILPHPLPPPASTDSWLVGHVVFSATYGHSLVSPWLHGACLQQGACALAQCYQALTASRRWSASDLLLRIKINRLSTPKSAHHNGSTHCLWNHLAGQISGRFSASFSGPLCGCRHAACCCQVSIDGVATMECILTCIRHVGHGRSGTDVVRYCASTACTRSPEHWSQMHRTFPRFS